MGTTTGNLTSDQLDQIKLDMSETIEMLNDAQVNALAQQVNKAINLPFLKEEKELIVFAKIIRRIDQKLYQLLPNEYYELIKDATDGITKEEAIVMEQRLTPLVNNAINIPILSEKQEEKLIRLILGLIINAMVKGSKLEEVAVKV
jgi:hypothetical protein